MRTKKVNRYWCDYCNKAGLQSRSMAIHEKHCTMNPARACRVCHLLEGSDGDTDEKQPLAELIKMLPDSGPYHSAIQLGAYDPEYEAHNALAYALTAVFPAFRIAAGNCPACMMAALRLAKIPVPMAELFDFKAEMQSIFSDMNDARNAEGFC